ncbi:MAG: hypothetical protein GXO58_02650 [Thermodesulfobacteria bacterium]|nr:hypothetical protein [Thermodesulfobacteriota bacterium]
MALAEKGIPNILLENWREIKEPSVIHEADKCLVANEAFMDLFHIGRRQSIQEMFMAQFISPWPSYHLRLGIRQALGRRLDGSEFDVEVISMPFYAAGDGMFYQSIVRDISRMKLWEDKMLQSERLTAMGKLAGEIAHEINNPLGGILLYANLVKEDLSPDHDASVNLEKIVKLATKCRIIAKGLLNFGRSSSRSYAPVDLNHVITEMFSLIEDHKLFAGVRTDFELEPELPHLMGDRGQLEQVIINLLINAAEAVNGHGRIRVATRSQGLGPNVELVVDDSGPGITDELRLKIFEPFFTTKQHRGGTGLGLSITHGIVQRHGGRIDVEESPFGGARFRIWLPLDRTYGSRT